LAGFYFNSALFRIAAAYHRGLKVVSGKETCRLYKPDLLKCVKPEFPEWQHTNLDDVYDEVNDLKHKAEGLFNSRNISRKKAKAAVAELLELLELWSKTQGH
jgi:oligoribonuclease (3'-5' exoribonuclease)